MIYCCSRVCVSGSYYYYCCCCCYCDFCDSACRPDWRKDVHAQRAASRSSSVIRITGATAVLMGRRTTIFIKKKIPCSRVFGRTRWNSIVVFSVDWKSYYTQFWTVLENRRSAGVVVVSFKAAVARNVFLTKRSISILHAVTNFKQEWSCARDIFRFRFWTRQGMYWFYEDVSFSAIDPEG